MTIGAERCDVSKIWYGAKQSLDEPIQVRQRLIALARKEVSMCDNAATRRNH